MPSNSTGSSGLPATVPIYQSRHFRNWTQPDDHHIDGINYAGAFNEAAHHASRHADIIISWCCEQARDAHKSLPFRKPLVDLAQNCDRSAAGISCRTSEVADFFVAVSGPCRDIYPQDKRDRVEIIPNAVDPARVVPRFGRATMRQRWGVEPETKVVGFIGRYEREKRPQLIVHALADGGPLADWHAVFVGRGQLHEHLVLLAQELAPGRVHFEGYKQQLGDYFAAIDVLALPSDFEGDPLVVHEAQFAGVPIVATDMDCLKEHEQHFGKMAELIPIPARFSDLRQALCVATSDAFQVVTGNAHRATFANFTMPTIAARWEWFLFDAIDAWRRRETLGGEVKTVDSASPYECAT